MATSKDLIDSIKIIVQNFIKNAPYDKTYEGKIKTINSSTNNYDVLINGNVYTLPIYISRTLTINQIVKVVVPQNQWSKAFIL